MTEKEIEKKLIEYTVINSKFEEKRDYVSMSHAHMSIEDLLKQWKNGFQADEKARLKCYKGYQMEADLLKRVKDIFVDKITDGGEIEGFEGKVKGHPDFRFEGNPGDFKSVLCDDWMPANKLPFKVYCQMQAYMFYDNAKMALVIYESRQSGIIKAFWVTPNTSLQEEIDFKFKSVVKVINNNFKIN